MELEGRVWKDGKFWLIEIPALNLMTQGKNRKDALAMAEDAILGLFECYFESEVDENVSVTINDYGKELVGVTSNDTKLLLALSLIKQREKSGTTVREASERLGSKSPNAYAQYEKGKTNISLEKYEKLLIAANPIDRRHIRVV